VNAFLVAGCAVKDDIQQFRVACRELDMTDTEADRFSEYLHELKDSGEGGSKNDRGDFTWDELMSHGREFLEQERS